MDGIRPNQQKIKNLGLFESEREAAAVYNAAAVEHYREFAKLNELDQIL